MEIIKSIEYEKIFKDNISYDHLEGNEYDFFTYINKPYSGMGFSDSEISGRLNKLIIYEDGIEDGICRIWHDNGMIKEEVLKTGLQNGYKYKWSNDGTLIYKSIVLNGWVIYEKSMEDNGEIKEEIYKNNIINYIDVFKKYHYDVRRQSNIVSDGRFKDTKYINSVIDIFEKSIVDFNDNSINQIIEQLLELTNEENRNSLYDMAVNEEDIEIKDGIILYNESAYSGIISKFIDDENLDFNMLYSISECKDGKKNGMEIIWDFEGRLNPKGIEKYGVHYEEYCWWSKEIIKEIRYFEHGKLLEKQEWDNSSLKG